MAHSVPVSRHGRITSDIKIDDMMFQVSDVNDIQAWQREVQNAVSILGLSSFINSPEVTILSKPRKSSSLYLDSIASYHVDLQAFNDQQRCIQKILYLLTYSLDSVACHSILSKLPVKVSATGEKMLHSPLDVYNSIIELYSKDDKTKEKAEKITYW